MRITIVTDKPTSAVAYYRTIGPISVMCRQNGWTFDFVREVSWAVLSKTDILIISRPYAAGHVYMIGQAQALGVKVWVDFDDLMSDVPPENPAHSVCMTPEVQRAIIACIQRADAVSVSTQHLYSWVKKHRGDRVWLIKNAIGLMDFGFDSKPLPNRDFSVAWRGSATHHGDIMSVAEDLKHVVQSTEAAFHFIGGGLEFLKYYLGSNRLHFHQELFIKEYHQLLYSIRPKVLIVPLLDNGFNRAKSNIAWLEGTMCGAVTVAPALPEWSQAGILPYSLDGKGPSFRDVLFEALNMTYAEQERCVGMSKAAIEKEYTLAVQNLQREQLINCIK